MKLIYELHLEDEEFPLYTARAAELFEQMAKYLRVEAAGGPLIVSKVGWSLAIEHVGSIQFKEQL